MAIPEPTQPSILALVEVVTSVPGAAVRAALAAAFIVIVTEALESRSKKIVAEAIPPKAETPTSSLGIRCAAMTALEASDGLAESLSATRPEKSALSKASVNLGVTYDYYLARIHRQTGGYRKEGRRAWHH